jgi:P-type E1-E2 ATPase
MVTHSSQCLSPYNVFRSSEQWAILHRLPAAELVSGDIVKITMGSKVPADMRLLDISSDLRFDRSILTGESNAIAATIESTDPNCNDTSVFSVGVR